jgi:hypothetical protein
VRLAIGGAFFEHIFAIFAPQHVLRHCSLL